MPRLLPILCTLALVPFLLLLAGHRNRSGLLHSLPSLGLAWLLVAVRRGYGHWLLPNSSEMGPVVGVVGWSFWINALADWADGPHIRLGIAGPRTFGISPVETNHWVGHRWNGLDAAFGRWNCCTCASGLPLGYEFGGYDVLSYHLALPADWWTLGRMGPLTTNAYSGLPGGAESAFLHLHALSGGTHDVTGLAAQMLCAILTINTASLLRQKNAAAALVFLMTPWIMVTGSMAYTEALSCFLLAMHSSP